MGNWLPPIILIGKSGSGKDTTAKLLSEKYNLTRVSECTTRKMRDGEIDGENYHFISESDFVKGIEAGEFVAYAVFNRIQDGVTDTVYYGIRHNDVTHNTVIPTNPENMDAIKKEYRHAIVVYLYVPDRFRTKRLVDRGDDPDEVERRAAADDIDFDPVKLTNVDITIYNTNSVMTPEMVVDEIIERVKSKVGA